MLLWGLLCRCRERGVTRYDLGGIDPLANPGVYDFKRQTGAREVEFLGEWDWASSPLLRWLGNWAIGRRQGFRKPRLRNRLNAALPPAAVDWLHETMIVCPMLG